MANLSIMKNLGKEMIKKLYDINITSSEMLHEIGAKKAFEEIKKIHPEVCLVHLYTLQGAVENIEFNHLSEETKKDLKKFSDSLKK